MLLIIGPAVMAVWVNTRPGRLGKVSSVLTVCARKARAGLPYLLNQIKALYGRDLVEAEFRWRARKVYGCQDAAV